MHLHRHRSPILTIALLLLLVAACVAQDAPEAPTPPATKALLERIEAKHKDLRTLVIRFDQIKVSETFLDETKSAGELFLHLPDRLRCEYESPDPTVLLFSGNTFYQYTPAINQVDKYTYESKEEAQRQLRILLLGFGLSSAEILGSYRVEAPDPGPDGAPILAFQPLDEDLARTYAEFRVWFDPDSLLPRKVRIEEQTGDVTTLILRDTQPNAPIDDQTFVPDFPSEADVVEH